MPKHIIIADDHPLFSAAMSSLVKHLDKNFIINEVKNCSSLIELLNNSHSIVSLVLLDLKLLRPHKFEELMSIRKQFPSIPIVIISVCEDNTIVQQVIQYGASGFISKSLDMPTMAQAISQILKGDVWFP